MNQEKLQAIANDAIYHAQELRRKLNEFNDCYEQMPQKDDNAFWDCWDCGDTDLTEAIDAFECSLKYGCPPIVTNVGNEEIYEKTPGYYSAAFAKEQLGEDY